MINRDWYCDWKMGDNELSKKLSVANSDERNNSLNRSIKDVVDELLEYFIEEVRDDVIKKLDIEWEFFIENNEKKEDCLYKFWYLIEGYLRRGKKGSNIDNVNIICY